MANSKSTLQGRDKDAYEYDSAIGWQRKSKVTNTPSEPIPSSIVDSDGNEAKVSEDHLKIEIKQSDFRLMLAYQYKILKQLEKLNDYMSLITGDEI